MTAIARRRYRQYSLSRMFTFGPGLILPLWGWADLHEPLHWAGLGVMTAAGLAVIPVIVIWVLFILPAFLLGGFVPRQWRINHRMHHDRALCKSAYISASLRRAVKAADRHRCLYCGITERELAFLPPRVNLEGKVTPRRVHVDHGMPWKIGGRTTFANCGLLCDEHNEIKLNYWRERNGYVWYRPQARTPERLAMAADITRVVRRRLKNPLRLWRAAWALG